MDAQIGTLVVSTVIVVLFGLAVMVNAVVGAALRGCGRLIATCWARRRPTRSPGPGGVLGRRGAVARGPRLPAH